MSLQEAVVSAVSDVRIDRNNIIQCWWYNFNKVRKLAHVGEYFPLGISVAIPLCLMYKNKNNILNFFICFVVSVFDQILKGILPTREFDEMDFILDMIGYAMGILTVLMYEK